MAGFASQAALRSPKWAGDHGGGATESGSSAPALPAAAETVTAEAVSSAKGIKNVVGWLKQASIEVREAGKRAVTQIQQGQQKHQQHQHQQQQQHNPATQNRPRSADPHDPAAMPNDDAPQSSSEAGGHTTTDPTCSSTASSSTEATHQPVAGDANSDRTTAILTILHFNDVYNIDSNTSVEPIGGAARFCTAIKSLQHLDPLVLFSGDAFSPSMLSTFTKGEQMVPVLNSIGTHCAVFGNHDFDHGLAVLAQHIAKTTFPWLMSNVVDNETGRPLGGGKITHYFFHSGVRVGVIGLVEREWLDTLWAIDPKEVTYIDYIKAGNQLADELLHEGCEMIIALTHMRTPNDIELAKHCPKIDLILGGHDHVYEDIVCNGTHIVKSGTDFRQFSNISVGTVRNATDGKLPVNVEAVNVTAAYAVDEPLATELAKYSATIEAKMSEVLGTFGVELEGRFAQIRTSETNLGNWVCDVLLSATGADVVMINSGTFRSDQVHPAGPFTMRDLVSVVPMRDPLVVLEVKGSVLLAALENSVAMWPKLEGRFPQVSGIAFVFDAAKAPGMRVESRLVQIGDNWLNEEQTYTLCIKSYIFGGCDGYTMFKGAKVLVDEDSCPEIGLAIQNHFHAIDVHLGKAKHSKHRQSLVTLSRRHSMVQMLDNVDLDGPSPVRRRISIANTPKTDLSHSKTKLCRRASLEDLEQASCQLAPTVQQRIVAARNEEHIQQMLRKRETMDNTTIIAEVDENNM